MPGIRKMEDLKNNILGKDYSLSVAYVSERKSREINKKYRKKDRPANVLSFPLRRGEGEILLCKAVIKNEAKNFKETFDKRLSFLLIHGMLHLKGLRHGKKMEKLEKKYLLSIK